MSPNPGASERADWAWLAAVARPSASESQPATSHISIARAATHLSASKTPSHRRLILGLVDDPQDTGRADGAAALLILGAATLSLKRGAYSASPATGRLK